MFLVQKVRKQLNYIINDIESCLIVFESCLIVYISLSSLLIDEDFGGAQALAPIN